MNRILEKPLILGASVSADHKAPSPGKNLALRYTRKENIRVMAQNGMPGQFVLKRLSPLNLRNQSVVIGIDLFFWDSILPSATESVLLMQKLVDETKAARIPLVLGNVPDLIPGFQRQRQVLKRALEDASDRYEHCHLLDLSELFRGVRQNGALHFGAKSYSMRELLPDGLHIGPVASDYIAGMIEKSLSAA